MRRDLIDQSVEAICQKGCRSVREDIHLLRQGVILPELKEFDDLARQMVLKELRSIMAVYGNGCPIVQPVERERQFAAWPRKEKYVWVI
ncbi:MAG: hypothetical protein KZQ89_20575 [Candidatus Thiodiazotropha sp. (ex Lucinoma kastoroae)]|nr:hypothetical protein [Candidatus Thiodiazotropha sp. (ex Lucinoma kastoroae)]